LGQLVNFLEEQIDGQRPPGVKAGVKAAPPRGLSSKYVGVNMDTRSGKWRAYMVLEPPEGSASKVRGKNLGYFDAEVEAARKYDEHATLLGRPVNFPAEGQALAKKAKHLVREQPPWKKRGRATKVEEGLQDEEDEEEGFSESDEPPNWMVDRGEGKRRITHSKRFSMPSTEPKRRKKSRADDPPEETENHKETAEKVLAV